MIHSHADGRVQDTGPLTRKRMETIDEEVHKVAMDFIERTVQAGKPVAIHKFIGRRPIAAFGNSDGDLQMLQWTAAGEGARFMMLIHHTDGEREWAYDRQSPIGRLDQALDEAQRRGWAIVDMKKDWNVIYPFQQ